MTFVFDYDGTLHDSMKIYAQSFRKCCELMKRSGIIPMVKLKNG